MGAMANVVIIGGGPGGYEAAMVAAQLGGSVTLIEDEGMGGSAVLTDVVPSKSLIATAEVMTRVRHSRELGLVPADPSLSELRQAVRVDLAGINERLLGLAAAQSHDIAESLTRQGVRLIHGRGRLLGTDRVLAAVFAVLGVLPLVVLAQLGVIVCFGVLLDTLVVRTLLVPSLALTLGERFWWPRKVSAA